MLLGLAAIQATFNQGGELSAANELPGDATASHQSDREHHRITHSSVIKTTFLLYFATPAGMTAACDAMGAVSIIGLWKPYV